MCSAIRFRCGFRSVADVVSAPFPMWTATTSESPSGYALGHIGNNNKLLYQKSAVLTVPMCIRPIRYAFQLVSDGLPCVLSDVLPGMLSDAYDMLCDPRRGIFDGSRYALGMTSWSDLL